MIENTTVTTALIVVGIFVVLLIAVAIYSIAKKRVAKATARAMEAHDTMQKAINQSDRLIVALNLRMTISTTYMAICYRQTERQDCPSAQSQHSFTLTIWKSLQHSLRSCERVRHRMPHSTTSSIRTIRAESLNGIRCTRMPLRN